VRVASEMDGSQSEIMPNYCYGAITIFHVVSSLEQCLNCQTEGSVGGDECTVNSQQVQAALPLPHACTVPEGGRRSLTVVPPRNPQIARCDLVSSFLYRVIIKIGQDNKVSVPAFERPPFVHRCPPRKCPTRRMSSQQETDTPFSDVRGRQDRQGRGEHEMAVRGPATKR
jgi:hypothetical protein